MELLISATRRSNANRRLRRLEHKVGGSTSLMAEIAELVATKNAAAFGRGVKLAPETVKWKAREGESQDPLVESGEMKDELTTDRGIKLLTPTELVFGSSSKVERGGQEIPLAKAHLLQRGSKHQRKHRVLRVTPTTRRLISELVMRRITED